MEIHFCECGGIFEPIGKGIVRCRRCGKQESRDVKKITNRAEKSEMIVVEDNTPDRLPVTKKICPRCGNESAYWWIIQTRSSDEPPTRFYRCTSSKCKHTWREYS